MEKGIIAAPVISVEMKQVLMERLESEIISKLVSSGSISGNRNRKKRRRESPSENTKPKKDRVDGEKVDARFGAAESVVRSRFVVGINQCVRILECALKKEQSTRRQTRPGATSTPTPSLVVLSRDVRPATILARLSLYANLLHIPTLVLPGKASTELGKAVGIRSVACAVFLSSSSYRDGGEGEGGASSPVVTSGEDAQRHEREWKETQQDVDAFVKYAISKIPK